MAGLGEKDSLLYTYSLIRPGRPYTRVSEYQIIGTLCLSHLQSRVTWGDTLVVQ